MIIYSVAIVLGSMIIFFLFFVVHKEGKTSGKAKNNNGKLIFNSMHNRLEEDFRLYHYLTFDARSERIDGDMADKQV